MQPALFSRVLPGDLVHDTPVLSLIAANLVTILIAVLGNWNLATVVFIYWVQSVIIGIFAVLSILCTDMPESGAGITVTSTLPDGTRQTRPGSPRTFKAIMAGFFAVHYGGFHLVYFFFITGSEIFGPVGYDDPGILLSCGLFFAIHAYSFLYHSERGETAVAGMMTHFTEPYDRILPMHLTIIFGSFLILGLEFFGIRTVTPVLVFFLLAKTYADVAGHIRKHTRVPSGTTELLD